MIIERTSQPWSCVGTLYRHSYHISPYRVGVTIERCARTLKIGAVFRTYLNGDLKDINYYKLPASVSYLDAITQILSTDYGYFRTNGKKL